MIEDKHFQRKRSTRAHPFAEERNTGYGWKHVTGQTQTRAKSYEMQYDQSDYLMINILLFIANAV